MGRRIDSGALSFSTMYSVRHSIAFALLILLPAAFTAAQTSAPAKKKSTSTAKKRTTAARKTTGKRSTPASANRQSWRTRQMQPTEQRYKEIQRALGSKGYLQGEPTGSWNQESVDALKRFQQDQKLEPTGKIDSLSLIALGLGPKHVTANAAPPPQSTPPASN